jgi:hypothetical protein
MESHDHELPQRRLDVYVDDGLYYSDVDAYYSHHYYRYNHHYSREHYRLVMNVMNVMIVMIGIERKHQATLCTHHDQMQHICLMMLWSMTHDGSVCCSMASDRESRQDQVSY